jgi:hypothetical protein
MIDTMHEDNRDPLDPTRKFSEGGGQEHRWALGIDCPVCPSKAGAWCAQIAARADQPARPISTWSLHGARITQARDPELLYAQIAKLRAAFIEAIDLFDATWCTEHGHAPSWNQLARAAELRIEHGHAPSKDQLARAAGLRRLVKP